MAQITGSSTIDWSGILLGQVNIETDIAKFATRVDQIVTELVNFQVTPVFVSSTTFVGDLSTGGRLTLTGSGFGDVLNSFDFKNPPDGTGEVIRFTGTLDGIGKDVLTSATIGSTGFSETIKGNITISPNWPFDSANYTGTLTSLVVKIGGATEILSGNFHLTGDLLSASLTGTVAGILVGSGANTIKMTGLSMSLDVLQAALGSPELDSVDDLFAFLNNHLPGNDTITYANNSSVGMTFYGGGGNDTMTISGPNADTLNGGVGNDTLNGGAGNDTLLGGDGNDVFLIRSATDHGVGEVIDGGAGSDVIRFTSTNGGQILTLATGVTTVESVVISTAAGVTTGTTALNVDASAVGNGLSLTGNAGANRLTGTSTNDTMNGGAGNDTLIGGAGEDTVTGGTGNDRIVMLVTGGNVDVADGVAGNDTLALVGAIDGDGVVVVDLSSLTDQVTHIGTVDPEKLVQKNFENLDASGLGSSVHATGSADANIIIGSDDTDSINGGAGNDTLNGGAGDDTLLGGDGNDVFLIGNAADHGGGEVIDGGTGADVIRFTSITDGDGLVLRAQITGVESVVIGNAAGLTTDTTRLDVNAISVGYGLSLTGNAGDNQLVGTDFNDVLNGGGGDDSLNGGLGTNTLIGGTGNDLLDGSGGTNTLIGGAGNDQYVIDSSTDVVIEALNAGTDLVISFIETCTLGLNVENLILVGNNTQNGTGNALNNIIYGNVSSNQLSGLAGNDTLTGDWGEDIVDGGAGNDRIVMLVTAGDVDTADGGTGTDTLVLGGAVGGNGIVVVNLVAGAGDQVTFSDDTLVQNNFENLDASYLSLGGSVTVTGSAGANSLIGSRGTDTINGGGGNDTLDGGAGDDTLNGGNGNDVILIGNAADHGGGEVINGGTGTDVIRFTSTTDGEGLVLRAQVTGVESVVIGNAAGLTTGTTALNVDASALSSGLSLTGNAGDNVLTGTGGNNILNGGAGNDTLNGGGGINTLIGGTGNDRYIVNSLTDVVSEALNAGTDTVVASLTTYTLTANVDNLELAGAALIGIGNTLNNIITGNDGDNTLSGLAGNDILIGGAGQDTINGGVGNDRIVMLVTAGNVDIADGGAGIDTLALVGAVDGDGVVVDFSSVTDQVTRIGAVEHESLVQKNFENLDASGLGLGNTVTVTGSAGANLLIGSNGADSINGGVGNDILTGGAGSDMLNGGDGNDIVIWDSADTSVRGGAGTDTLRIDGAGVHVNLTVVPDGVITDIEVINLTGSGNNILTLASADVLAISTTTDTLRVDGNSGDVVSAVPGWVRTQNIVIDAQTYAQYTNDGALLQVDTDINSSGIGAISLSSLTGANGFKLLGAGAGDHSGISVSCAGDVNGDGFADLIVGASDAAPHGLSSGASYVVFGKASGFAANINLSSLNGTDGFMLSGIAANDQSGISVSSAGDVNGDGFSDLIIGAPGATIGQGASYVVFGEAGGFGSTIDLSSLDGITGFKLSGTAANEQSGFSVSGAGDVNGDGFDDIVIGSPSFNNASWVVFGKVSGFPTAIAVSALNGVGGFGLGENFATQFGHSVSSAGDFNGDGLDDVIIGAPLADVPVFSGGFHPDNGAGYLWFGKSGGFTMNSTSPLKGTLDNDHLGFSVSGVGDVNGDGFDDVILGAIGADTNGPDSGASYVVFGFQGLVTPDFELSSLNGTNGFRILGAAGGDQSGFSVSGAGDVNGDGFDDLIIGAPDADPHGLSSGAIYVIFGKPAGFSANLDLSTLSDADGFKISGAAVGDNSGSSVSSAGDVNGDGFDDLIVGAPSGDPNGSGSGASYVVFGADFRGDINIAGTAGDDILTGTDGADIVFGGLGNDTLDGGAAADFLNGNAGDDILIFDGLDRRIDGGSGTDTLLFNGSGQTLDLTSLANSKINGIETINLTGSGDNALILTGQDLHDLSDTSNALRVDGNPGDTVNAGFGWGFGSNVTIGNQAYVQYTQGNAVLRVDSDIALTIGNAVILSALSGTDGFKLNDAVLIDSSGRSVSGAGDVNGDGFDDLIVGVSVASPNGDLSGQSYVVFGNGSSFVPQINLPSLDGTNGFQLSGEAADDRCGGDVSSAGDINGDGFDDLIVGASLADSSGSNSGASYVVFGHAGGFAANLELSSLNGTNGFKLSGAAAGDRLGTVSEAGDVNGDGFDDLIVGAPSTSPNGSASGASYVVFGKSGGFASNINLSSLDGTNGFKLSGIATEDISGASVSGAGDMNGDGFGDIIIGAPGADLNNPGPGYFTLSGQSYVVFGKAGGFDANVNLSDLNGTNGFKLNGANGDESGSSVSAAGDVNGDGFTDVIIGTTPVGTSVAASYVVFGKGAGFAEDIELSLLDGTDGFKLIGGNELSSHSVSSAGDVNGDGFDDLVVGASRADASGIDSGQSYVVYGKSGGFGATLVLSQITESDGFVINNTAFGIGDGFELNYSGSSVSGSGDVNGDGFDDLLVSAQGASFEMFGGNFTRSVDFLGTSGNDILIGNGSANILIGGLGNDTLDGGAGDDRLAGGLGNDTFFFGLGDGQDLVRDNSGSADKISFDGGINPLNLVISRQANDLRIAIHGTSDQITVQNWYTSSVNRTETIQAGNGEVLLSTQVDQLIQAMAQFTTDTGLSWEGAIESGGTPQQQTQFQGILAASWQ